MMEVTILGEFSMNGTVEDVHRETTEALKGFFKPHQDEL